MTSIQAARKAIALYRNPHIDKATQRHNQRQYLRALNILGPSWILASPITKQPKQARRQLNA